MTITPEQYSKTQRRFLTTLGGLGVVALAAGTFVLSYDDLRLLALRGGAARHWAFLYPWMLDGLVVVIILAILTARRSGWFSRAVRWLLLFALIAGAGAAGVQRAVKGYAVLPDTWVNVGVAVAPWAILMIAVWLWVSMIKQVLSRRARRSRPNDPAGPAGAVEPAREPVPTTVLDQSIIPGLGAGLGAGETRQLPLPASVRELEPVREPVRERARPAPPEDEPEPNPWDAARLDPLDAPEPRDHAEPAGPPEPGPEPWSAERPSPAGPEPVPAQARDAAGSAGYAEPSDPVPASWRDEPSDLDDVRPLPPGAARTAPSEPEPLLPPTVSRLGESRREEPSEEPEPMATPPATDAPEPIAEAPMNDEPTSPNEDEPTHHLVARTSLPTDVRLVGGPKPRPLSDTQPDGIRLPGTKPDGIPLVHRAKDVADEEDDAYVDERAEDPDAGEDATGAQWEDMESTPPSSKFRSSPTPPRD
jgi:hypothetical protein